jgi:hypothetical protein
VTLLKTVPKYKEKVRSCKIKNKTIADDMRALEEEGAKKVPPIDGSLLLANCKAKHLNFCSYPFLFLFCFVFLCGIS